MTAQFKAKQSFFVSIATYGTQIKSCCLKEGK